MIAAQNYGGEMLLRIYFFTPSFMCFFAASLFFDNSAIVARKSIHCVAVRCVIINIFFCLAFLFLRYGDEHVNYISYGEWNAFITACISNNSIMLSFSLSWVVGVAPGTAPGNMTL